VNNRRKIVIISAVFPPEPVVSAILSKDIAERMSLYYDVTVLCPVPTRPQGYRVQKSIQNKPLPYEVIYLQSYTCPESKIYGRLKESKSFGKYCTRYIESHYNKIATIYVNAWPLFSQKAIVKTAKRYKIPCILHIQDIYPESITKKLPSLFNRIIMSLYLPMDKYILKNATHIIGISLPMISYLSLSRNIPLSKFTLVRNWQNDKAFSKYISDNVRDKHFVFMYVGSIASSAGVDNIIKAYNNITQKNTKLIIAGNGTEKENCIHLARELNNSSVKFVEVSPDKVPELQSKADVLILPLKKGIAKTATPSKLTAYLLSGKPVIACVEKNTDVADIIKNGQCGIIVEPEEIGQLTEVLSKTVNMDKVLLAQMGENARKFALKELSKEVNLSKLISLVQEYAI
jgi:glycosyltransferase involved in cell wall biosynthesis